MTAVVTMEDPEPMVLPAPVYPPVPDTRPVEAEPIPEEYFETEDLTAQVVNYGIW